MKQKVKDIIKNNQIFFKKHALKRMMERNISIKDVKIFFENFEIIETYTKDNALPLFLALGKNLKNEPLHILFALNTDKIWIITCYEPDKKLWDETFTKRRKNL